MGTCKYCGKPAGPLRSKHCECENKYKLTFEHLTRVSFETIIKSSSLKDFEELERDINNIAPDGYLTTSDVGYVLVSAFERAVEHFLNDGALSVEEQGKIESFVEFFKLDKTNSTEMVRGAGSLKVGACER